MCFIHNVFIIFVKQLFPQSHPCRGRHGEQHHILAISWCFLQCFCDQYQLCQPSWKSKYRGLLLLNQWFSETFSITFLWRFLSTFQSVFLRFLSTLRYFLVTLVRSVSANTAFMRLIRSIFIPIKLILNAKIIKNNLKNTSIFTKTYFLSKKCRIWHPCLKHKEEIIIGFWCFRMRSKQIFIIFAAI